MIPHGRDFVAGPKRGVGELFASRRRYICVFSILRHGPGQHGLRISSDLQFDANGTSMTFCLACGS